MAGADVFSARRESPEVYARRHSPVRLSIAMNFVANDSGERASGWQPTLHRGETFGRKMEVGKWKDSPISGDRGRCARPPIVPLRPSSHTSLRQISFSYLHFPTKTSSDATVPSLSLWGLVSYFLHQGPVLVRSPTAFNERQVPGKPGVV